MPRHNPHCPIANAHKRMEDAHHLWHEALDVYGEPEGFRVKLNACVQALRTVTWLIQKSKKNIPKFDCWYEPWQGKMKQDLVLSWLKDARNKIEKEGDLDTKSTALVSVHSNRFSSPVLELYVDPFKTTPEIAKEIAISSKIAEELRKSGALRVERRWVANNLPEVELLEALAQAYGFMNSLINSAHTQIGLQATCVMKISEKGKPEEVLEIEHLKGRLPCMAGVAEGRAIWINLSDREAREFMSFRVEVNEEEANRAAQRYGLTDIPHNFKGVLSSLLEKARFFMEVGKRTLQKDHCHDPVVLLEFSKSGPEIRGLEVPDPGDWPILFNKMAANIERNGAIGIIFISEIWIAPFDRQNPNQNASESSKRMEALKVVAARENGEEVTLTTVFQRDGGKINFGKVEEAFGVRNENSFLEPIRRVWRKRQM